VIARQGTEYVILLVFGRCSGRNAQLCIPPFPVPRRNSLDRCHCHAPFLCQILSLREDEELKLERANKEEKRNLLTLFQKATRTDDDIPVLSDLFDLCEM
jgi:hypothetical protein